MAFKAILNDPSISETKDMGVIDNSKVIETFDSIDWNERLQRIQESDDSGIHYYPSFEIKNKENNASLSVSAVGSPNNYEWYVFYKRPGKPKGFLGLREKFNKDKLTQITSRDSEEVKECLLALINNDLEFLEEKIP